MNVSKQLTTTSSEDTFSMYLSFDDSETNFSYKSVQTVTQDEKHENEEEDDDDSKGNVTLEPLENDEEFCNTMKELSTVLAPLRSSVSVLREFNVLNSTPSKTEDDPAGSARVGSLRRSLRLKGNASANFENIDSKAENGLAGEKKNILDLMPTTSVNDQNTEEILPEEETKQDKENTLNAKEKTMTPASLKRQQTDSSPSNEKKQQRKTLNSKISITSPSKMQPKGNQVNKAGFSLRKIVEKSKSKALEKKEKMHSVVRQSLCEPDLEHNRPSRIIPKKNVRMSYANPRDAVNVAKAAWPGLSSTKSSGFKDGKKLEMINEGVSMPQAKSGNSTTRKSVNPSNNPTIVGRKSFLQSASSAPQRNPNVVKTTLNSSIRKAAPRRSMASDTMSNATSKRRSVLLMQNKLGSSPMTARKKVSYRYSSTTSSDEATQITRPTGGGGTLAKSSNYNAKSEIKFTCAECGGVYKTKALFETHKRTHLKAVQEVKKTRALGLSSGNANAAAAAAAAAGNASGSASSNNKTCKYCDKTFAIERALHIHLMQHCPKIPAIERRKLDFDEMNHVVKAEIPHFRPTAKELSNAGSDSIINSAVKDSNEKFDANFKSLRNKMENIFKTDEKKPSERTAKPKMAPPNSTKIKKTAHTGVFRTPNKEIQCISCKQSFKNIIGYTSHMMTAHSANRKNSFSNKTD